MRLKFLGCHKEMGILYLQHCGCCVVAGQRTAMPPANFSAYLCQIYVTDGNFQKWCLKLGS